MWDLPGPGLEPVSPALAGGFLTTAPPGKPLAWYTSFNFKKTDKLWSFGLGYLADILKMNEVNLSLQAK